LNVSITKDNKALDAEPPIASLLKSRMIRGGPVNAAVRPGGRFGDETMRLLATACLVLLLLVGCNAGGKSSRPLSKTATLEVHYVSVESIPGSQETTDPSTGDPVFLTMPAIITAADVASVRRMDEQSPNSSLVVNLTEDGAKKLAAATAKHDDLRLALVVNGTCAAVPKVVATVSGPFAVTLSPKKCEALYRSLTGE